MGQTVEDIDRPEITIAGKSLFINVFLDLKTEIWRFSYFFLAPTLIYRDAYVQKKRVRIGFVL